MFAQVYFVTGYICRVLTKLRLFLLFSFSLHWHAVTTCGVDVRIHMPHSRTVQAELRNNKARVTYDKPSAHYLSYNIKIQRTQGPSSGSWFYGGTTKVEYKFSAAGHSDKRSFNVVVNVDRCSKSAVTKPFYNGDRHCQTNCGEPNVNGVICTHSCHDGFHLKGSRTVTCDHRTWSSSFPECKPSTCYAPPDTINRGSWLCNDGYEIYKTCLLGCDAGYSSRGTTTITCQESGRWQSFSSSCADTEAPELYAGCVTDKTVYSEPKGQPAAATWDDPPTSDNSRGHVTVTYNKTAGSKFSLGRHSVTVTARDDAGNIAQCTFHVTVEARLCQALQVVEHGTAVRCTYTNMEGSQCTFGCQPGYEIHGRQSLTCQRSKQWDGVPPQCLRISCGQPPSLRHGHFECDRGTKFTDVCQLVCFSGFIIKGPSDVTCQADKSWSKPGFCFDVEPPKFLSGCEDREIFAARLGEPTMVRWPDPQVSDNSLDPVTFTNDVSRVRYQPGVTRVNITATDQTGNSESCTHIVTVTSLKCDEPNIDGVNPDQSKMIYNPSRHGYVYGVTWGVGCPEGDVLLGTTIITCEVDNSTYPPVPRWEWPGGRNARKPTCVAVSCPKLWPPANGALGCFPGDMGVDCTMSCNAKYEIPRIYNNPAGLFSCSNARQIWIPSTVPDCIVPLAPNHVRLKTDIHYYAAACDRSLDNLKQDFIRRLTTSDVYRDACVGVPLCVWENIQVTCGPERAISGRKKRSQKEMSVVITLELKVKGAEDRAMDLQEYASVQQNITAGLQRTVNRGELSFEGLSTHSSSVGTASLHCDCPDGTSCSVSARINTVSCVGCSKGHYMPEGDTECHECPRGSYQGEDVAVACTPCPPGMSTVSAASHNVTQCV